MHLSSLIALTEKPLNMKFGEYFFWDVMPCTLAQAHQCSRGILYMDTDHKPTYKFCTRHLFVLMLQICTSDKSETVHRNQNCCPSIYQDGWI